MGLVHLKHNEYDKRKHWHLQKKHESSDHHMDDESSSSYHHSSESSSSSSCHHSCESSSSSSSHHSCESSSSSSHHRVHESSSSSHHRNNESSSSSSSSSHHWDPPKHQKHCVEDVLKAILHAQKKVKNHNQCDTSCNESIKQLLSKSKKPKKNTIPFILYCGDCEPFKATGVTTCTSHCKKEKFICITSFIFRIKAIRDNCAVLELLNIKSEKRHSSDTGKKRKSKDVCSPCSQIHCADVQDLEKTGICITLDLSCICAITCLPPVFI